MIRVLTSLLFAIGVTSAAAAQVDDVAAGFVAALTANNIAAFDAVAAGDATALNGLKTLRETLERYDCIQVASYRAAAIAPNRIRVDLDATATTHGRNRGRTAFPRTWVVDTVCDGACRITAVATGEDHAAAELLARPESEWRSCPAPLDIEEGPYVRALASQTDAIQDPALRIRAFDFILERAAADGDVGAQVWCIDRLALAQRGLGDSAAASVTARRALDLALERGGPDDIAGARFVLGTTLWVNHEIPAGLEQLRQTSAMIARLDDPRTALKAMAMRTFISQQAGDLRAALVSANELIAGSRRYRWPQGEAAAGLYLGTLHGTMGDVAGTLFYFRGALRKASELREGRLIGMALKDCGQVENALRHYDQAIALTRRSLEFYGKTISPLEEASFWIELSSEYRKKGDLVAARDAFEHGRTLASDYRDGRLSSTIYEESSELRQAEGDLRGALDDAMRAIELGKQGGVMFAQFSAADAWIRAARVQIALGHDAEAIALLREAVSLFESERGAYAGGAESSALFMETGREMYRTLIDLLVRRGRDRDAFEVSERMRGRVLGDVLAQGKIDVSAALTAAERAREEALERVSDDPGVTAAKRSEARAALERLETELLLIHPSLRLRRPLANDFRPRMPAKLADGAVIEYVVASSRTIVFSVTGSGVKAHVIPLSQKTIEARVKRLTAAIARRDYGYAAGARALYATLLEPVAGELRGRRAVYVVPDGMLWRVPFHALMDGDGHSLIESAAVSYAPSLATLRLALERRQRLQRKEATVAAIGNSSVAEADREIRTIASLYGRSKVDLGSSATPQRFRRDAARASVVHIAAHAVIDDAASMYSALMLAPEGHGDGALEARAIANLSLDAHTAVLSACETAGGGVGSGEGIIGLSWAFFLAGCPTTVASQWKTSSAPTATLMIDFHRHLIQGIDAAESLRAAELALARDPRYRHPFYWAPFVVMGAP